MSETNATLTKYSSLFNKDEFITLNEEMTFAEYVEKCEKNPKLLRNAFQYMYDMIMSYGVEEFERYRKTYKIYNFFRTDTIKETPIFGIEESLSGFVDFIAGAAGGYGTEKRVLLMHGPVGSSKSTICRRIKRGLEHYSRTSSGAWYTFKWVNLPKIKDDAGNDLYPYSEAECPLNENPIKLMPVEMREVFLSDMNKIYIDSLSECEKSRQYKLSSEGDLNPRCRLFMNALLKHYNGNWNDVVSNHIKVIRKTHSESDRVGIGTFQPKDEKNQDSTELTGDMNFRRIAHFGTDSDPRAFNFDGEFPVANRGVVEFIEMLKLDNAFLYDLLGASQEHSIKPKKFAQVNIDEVIIGHTNNPEFERLKDNRFMEALRDRSVKVDVPYLLRWSDELRVYESSYGPNKVRQHIMPHALEVAALFAVLTRLNHNQSDIDPRTKAKLYDGRSITGWTQDSVKELKDKDPDEGMKYGLSPRYIQDKIANVLARKTDYASAFEFMNEIKSGLKTSSLITNEDDIVKYEACCDLAMKELDEILKDEVQQALVSDSGAIERLCNKYIDHIIAFNNNEKIVNPITGDRMNPDEKFMRSIEEKAGIPDRGCEDFRRSMAGFIGSMAIKGQKFKYDSNVELHKALQAKLFEETKDSIKLSSLTKEAIAIDPDLQEKIDAIKTRMIKNYGYTEKSATDVLDYVSSIFARGDLVQ